MISQCTTKAFSMSKFLNSELTNTMIIMLENVTENKTYWKLSALPHYIQLHNYMYVKLTEVFQCVTRITIGPQGYY